MTVPEVIARLDVFERSLQNMVMEVRQIRHDLFETLDNTDDDVLD